MNNSHAHEVLQNDIMLAVGSLPEVRLHKRKVGFAAPIVGKDQYGNYKYGRPIKWGISGEADIQGWISPFGRGLAIEVKTGKGKLTSDQEKWKRMFEKQGGLYILGRDVETVTGIVIHEINRQASLQVYLKRVGSAQWKS